MTAATDAPTSVLVQLEGVLWSPETIWPRVTTHLASRLARVRPLDLDELDALPLPDQIVALDAWSGADIDWERESTRWLDENLALYLKPVRSRNQVARAIARLVPLAVYSALPAGPMSTVLRHIGLTRDVTTIHPRMSAAPPSVGTDTRLIVSLDRIHCRDTVMSLNDAASRLVRPA